MELTTKSSICFVKPRINADPEHIVHYEIGVRQAPNHAILAVFVGGLPQQISAKKKPRANLLCLECANQILARKGRILTNSNRKTEPRRIRARCRLGQQQTVLQRLERGDADSGNSPCGAR